MELFGVAALGFGGAAESLASSSKPSNAGVPKRTLGSTGLKISEIGFGGYPVDDPKVVLYAIDRGITYIDTSDDYRNGASERVIGEAIRSRRQDVVLATKIHPWKDTPKSEILGAVEGCLKRLRTDVIDLLQIHQVGKASGGQSIERLTNPALLEAMDELRRSGKVRFFGVTGHDGDLMDVFRFVLDSGNFQSMLMRYNLLDYADQEALIVRGRKAGVGTIAMKTLAGAKDADLARFRGKGTSFRQAALKWVLSNRYLSGLIISISSKEQVDEYAAAAGAPLTSADVRVLADYAASKGAEVCRFCNACEPACPENLRIADILRFGMYAGDYGGAAYTEKGRALYAGLRVKPEHCESCSAPCVAACPYELDVRQLTLRSKRLFES